MADEATAEAAEEVRATNEGLVTPVWSISSRRSHLSAQKQVHCWLCDSIGVGRWSSEQRLGESKQVAAARKV